MNNNLDTKNLSILCSEISNTFTVFSSTPSIEEVNNLCNTAIYKQEAVVFLGTDLLNPQTVHNAPSGHLFAIMIINSNNEHIVFNSINKTQALWIINNFNNTDIMYIFNINSAISVEEYILQLTVDELTVMYNSEVANAIICVGPIFNTIEVEDDLIRVTYANNPDIELYDSEEFLNALISAGDSLLEDTSKERYSVVEYCVSVFKEYLVSQKKALSNYYIECFGEYTWETIHDWMHLNDFYLKQPLDSFITISNVEELVVHSFDTAEEFLLFIIKECRMGKNILKHDGILDNLMSRQSPVFENLFGKDVWNNILKMLNDQEVTLIMENEKLFLVNYSNLTEYEVNKDFLLLELRKAQHKSSISISQSNSIDKVFKRINFTNYVHVDLANVLNKYSEHIYIDPFNQIYKVIPGTDNILISAIPTTFKDVIKEVFDTLYELQLQSRLANDVAMSEMVTEELEMLSLYI